MRAVPNDPNNPQAVRAAEAANAILETIERGLAISERIEDHDPDTLTGAYLRFRKEDFKQRILGAVAQIKETTPPDNLSPQTVSAPLQG